jgi:hypothetical protein
VRVTYHPIQLIFFVTVAWTLIFKAIVLSSTGLEKTTYIRNYTY